MESLVDTGWLSKHLGEPDLVVLDCTVHMEPTSDGGFRCDSGQRDFEGCHIPSAGFADLMGDLCDRDSPRLFAVPTVEQFCAAMGALGVGDDTRVVIYDGFLSVWAARVWWMLRWAGFDNAAILDGGLTAWTAEGHDVSTGPTVRPAQKLTPAPRPELIAGQNEVLAAIGKNDVRLVDTLPADQFRGDEAFYGRPGHIPGATNVFAGNLVDASGRFRADDQLAAMHMGDPEARTITYCGAGVMASSNAFVLNRLGFIDVAVYVGSLQEWAADPSNPMEVEKS